MTRPLADRQLTYADVGATQPALQRWDPPAGYRSYARTVRIGHGHSDWQQAAAVLRVWGVKTRSGFSVVPGLGASSEARLGDDVWLIARLGPLVIREPARVVATVDEPARCGFAYGTLEGHPISGEEAFVVHRSSDDEVWFTLRSLARAPQGPWRFALPGVLVAQRWYRRKYLRALTAGH